MSLELYLSALLIALLLALLVFVCCTWPRPDRRIRLRLTSISFNHKPKVTMQTNLRSSVNQFAQLILSPVNAGGTPVKLDEDAIVAEVVSGGTGARAHVQVLNDEGGGRRFAVSLDPGTEPGEVTFKVRGDAEPGEGVEILEEDFVYTATPGNAVSLGASTSYLPKSSFPTA